MCCLRKKTALAKLHVRSFRVCQDRALRGAKLVWMQMRPADRQKCSDNPYDNKKYFAKSISFYKNTDRGAK